MRLKKKKTLQAGNLMPKSSDTIPPPAPQAERQSTPPPCLSYLPGQRVKWKNCFGHTVYGRFVRLDPGSLVVVEADNGSTDILPPNRVVASPTGFYNIK